MTLKSILFGLFLYVSLVWVGAVYLYSGPKVEQFGLLWTAVALIGLLSIFIVSKVWNWIRVLRNRAALKPRRVKPLPPPVSEEEAAISALIAEANAKLGKRVEYVSEPGASPLSTLPLYLLVGPEGSGKTNTFSNSGLEPQLLAGEASGLAGGLPTRVCNFWFLKNAVFVEISGRLFNGDSERWHRVLKALAAKPVVSWWQQPWVSPTRGLELRGVVACCDVATFMLASSPQARERLDAQCRHWRERLVAIAESFGVAMPLYVLGTKLDAVSYFEDFFRRVSDVETAQVLGSTVSDLEGKDHSIEADAKRYTKSFNALYYSLAERRITQLAYEPDPSLR